MTRYIPVCTECMGDDVVAILRTVVSPVYFEINMDGDVVKWSKKTREDWDIVATPQSWEFYCRTCKKVVSIHKGVVFYNDGFKGYCSPETMEQCLQYYEEDANASSW